jgi:hypothetical protein
LKFGVDFFGESLEGLITREREKRERCNRLMCNVDIRD